MDNEGTFIWESGQNLTLDVAAYWRSGQPNGKKKENCVGVKDGEMWDIPCKNPMRFICQKRVSGNVKYQVDTKYLITLLHTYSLN